MKAHSSIHAWGTPWTEEPGGLQSTGLQNVKYNLVTKQQQQQHTTSAILLPFINMKY